MYLLYMHVETVDMHEHLFMDAIQPVFVYLKFLRYYDDPILNRQIMNLPIGLFRNGDFGPNCQIYFMPIK